MNSKSYMYFRAFSSNSKQVRVRFAPSPTGSLHLGGLRTALYNYIFAHQNNGKFILRIEDTDQSRVIPGAEKEIEDILEWANLCPDESPRLGGPFGPYRQSTRIELYRQHAERLLDDGLAYRCFCSQTRLELLRRYQAKNRQKIHYDRHCRNLTSREIQEKLTTSRGQFVIRFALNPDLVEFQDSVFGRVSTNFAETQESDPIIIKTDGYPTYHFANVIDDYSMQISHILRGSEWLSSTAKHIKLYEALKLPHPKFSHFPLISMTDGSKMSKRNSQCQVKEWIAGGFKPLTIINLLTNMGGGVSKEKQDSSELWDLETLVKRFDFNAITKHPGSVDQNRLILYSRKELQSVWSENPGIIMDELRAKLEKSNLITSLSEGELKRLVDPLISRVCTVQDLAKEEFHYLWQVPKLTWPVEYYIASGWRLRHILERILKLIEDSGDLNDLSQKLRIVADEEEVVYSELMVLLRKVLTNKDKGLPINDIAKQLGKERMRRYIERGIKYVQ